MQSKYLLILSCLLFLTACWPLEDNKKKNDSSEASLLPAVNNSLSAESPVGIWMLEIIANRFWSFYSQGFKENSTDHSSKFHNYKFLRIKKDAKKENSFIIDNCYFHGGGAEIFTRWDLAEDTLSSPKIETQDKVDGLFSLSNVTEGELKLTNNRKMSGTQSHLTEISLFSQEPGNPLVLPDAAVFQSIADIIFPKILKEDISIRGIKVSDKSDFSQASELNIQLNIPSIINDNTMSSSQLKCISVIAKNKSTLINNAKESSPKIIDSSADIFATHFTNDSFFFVENLTQNEKPKNINNLGMKSPNDSTEIKFSSNCLEDKQCNPISTLEQTSTLNTKGHLSTAVQYTSNESINETINISITVN